MSEPVSEAGRVVSSSDSSSASSMTSLYRDPVTDAYQKDIDRTLLRENLKLTVQERFAKFEKFMEYVAELRRAGQKTR